MRDSSDEPRRTLGARQTPTPEAEPHEADSRDDRPQDGLRRLGVELAASAGRPETSPPPGQEREVTPKTVEAFLDDQRVAAIAAPEGLHRVVGKDTRTVAAKPPPAGDFHGRTAPLPIGVAPELRDILTPRVGLNSRGDQVRQLHGELLALGISVPVRELNDVVFGAGTEAAIRQVQASAGLRPSGTVDAETRSVIDEALLVLANPPRVEGRLLTERGTPAGEMAVALVRRTAWGGTEQAGQGVSDTDGFYRIDYQPLDGPEAAGSTIELRVVAAGGEQTPIIAPILAPSRHEVMNLVVPTSALPASAAEFDRLSADVEREVGGFGRLARALTVTGEGLPAHGGADPIAAAHKITGWDARLLAFGGAATHLAETTGLDPRITYALVRYGLPADAEQLATVDAEAVRIALTRALQAGIVAMSAGDLQSGLAAFEGFATRARMDSRPDGGLSTYGQFLEVAGLGDQQNVLDRAILAHGDDPAKIWAVLKAAEISETKIAELQTVGKLAALTAQNLSLTSMVKDGVLAGGGDPSVEGLRALVEADLYQAGQWHARLVELAGGDNDDQLKAVVPPAFADGVPGRAAAAAYAEDLARQVRTSFPTAVVSRMVAKGDIPLGPDRAHLQGGVATIIEKAEGRGFSFSKTPLGPFLHEHGRELVAGLDPVTAQATIAEFERLQRLYQITPSNGALAVLAKLGIQSAQHVLGYGKREFIQQFGRDFADHHELQVIFEKTEQVAAVAYTFFGAAQQIQQPGTYGTSPSVARRDDVVESLIKRFPTIEELFGEQDFCACQHCRSVLSPAAYLVDLLNFLDVDRRGTRPFDVLTQRRPDLEQLPLTCENTNTTMPMLDLANEIMEYRVAKGTLDAGAAHETGSVIGPDLLAEPQHLEPAAYDKLAAARYPMTLPFDLWQETVGGYLGRMDVTLAGLLDAFRRSDELFAPAPPSANQPPYARAAVWKERLGLSTHELPVLTDQAELNAWFRLYGYESLGTARTELRSAKNLAIRLGVSYEELAELVKTWYVNPNLNAVATLRTIGVEVLDVLRYKAAPGAAPFTAAERDAFATKLNAATGRFGRPDFDAAAWLDGAWTSGRFNGLVLLSDTDPGCSFDATRLRVSGAADAADPAADSTLDAVLLRFNLLVRLWRRLGWALGQVDSVLRAMLPGGAGALLPGINEAIPAGLGETMRTALVYLAQLAEIRMRIGVGPRHIADLVTLWEPMPTSGPDSTYARLFLSPRTGTPNPVFDHPAGDYLSASAGFQLVDHRPAVEAALGMSAADVNAVLHAANRDPATTLLTLDLVSLLFRHALLAHALRLPIRDLIALRQLTGIDPFHPLHDLPQAGATPRKILPLPAGPTGPDVDYPLSGTLALLEVVDHLQAAGMSADELSYLLRHAFDPVGPYRQDEQALLRLAAETADGIRRLEDEHAPPAPGEEASLSDDAVARELGLVLSGEASATVVSMWQRQIVYTATKPALAKSDQISPASVAAFPELTVDYIPGTGVNANSGSQKLTYRGVPVPSRVAAISAATGATPKTVLGELLGKVAEQARTDLAGVDWLIEPGDAEALFAPPPDPVTGGDPAAHAKALQDHERERRAHFAGLIMPRVLTTLRRRFVVATVGGALGQHAPEAEPAMVEALLTDPRLLTGPGGDPRALLDVLADVAAAGLSVTATDAAGNPMSVPDGAGQDATTANISGAARITLDGYLQVPNTGVYTFVLSAAGSGDAGRLWIGDGPDALLRATGPTNAPQQPPNASAELRADVLYRFTLEAAGAAGGGPGTLSGVVSVQVEADTLALGSVSRLALRPATQVRRFVRAYVLATKALLLLGRLELSERELRYLRRHPDEFAGFDLSALPTDLVPAGVAAALFGPLRRLLAYLRLRSEMAGGTDELISVFELSHSRLPGSAGATVPEVTKKVLAALHSQVAALTRRDPTTVSIVASHLRIGVSVKAVDGRFEVGPPAPADAGLGYADERGLRRLWDALVLVEQLGVGPEVAIKAATPAPDATVARSLRDALRARYDLDSWRSLARAVNDPLRQRRRDALVAYLLHELRLERLEQLYELLLLDPGTEPVVLTTRIRQAIAAVQLFVQRCLLNLEDKVPPAAIDAERWGWMRRYRVWEANRKIFLFPENWLDPELRDDQTHLFSALTGALLQGDVTDQLAEDAFVAYLRGVAEIARLEIVSVWSEEDPYSAAGNVLHVLGRDHNAPRSHYYRRFANGLWTPWEPVGTRIDSDHACIVMFRGRLHIFWLTFLSKTVNPSTGGTSIRDMANQPPPQSRSDVQAQLNWTELVSGQWAARASSDMITLYWESPKEFAPEKLYTYALRAEDGSSVIIAMTGEFLGESASWIGLRFASRNAHPMVVYENPANEMVPWLHPLAMQIGYQQSYLDWRGLVQNENLGVRFPPPKAGERDQGPGAPVLAEARWFTLVAPPQPAKVGSPQISALVSPFFYTDTPEAGYSATPPPHQQTFFVMPKVTEKTFVKYKGYIELKKAITKTSISNVRTVAVEPAQPTADLVLTTGQLLPLSLAPVHPSAKFGVAQPADWTSDPASVVSVGALTVGANGVLPADSPGRGRTAHLEFVSKDTSP
jgi:hypothetical protein